MGSAQSYMSSEAAIASLFIAGAVTYGYVHYTPRTASEAALPAPSSGKSKKKKKAASPVAPQPEAANVVLFPPVIPGDFDAAPVSTPAAALAAAEAVPTKPAKTKKKKGKKAGTPVGGAPRTQPADAMSESSATAPESSVRAPASKAKKGAAQKQPAGPLGAGNADESWTRVESRRRTATPQGQEGGAKSTTGASAGARPEVSTSDAGITTSVTGTSSPVTERTEDDALGVEGSTAEKRRTLAEKMLPKPRKTGVDDMLETPDYPTVARVMRIQPGPNDRPAAGFSWGDYEDVDESRVTADDADGEDDDGWGVVKTRRARTTKAAPLETPTQSTSEPTKRQRQNAARAEAQKAAKQDAEVDRLARLAQHKRQLEREKIAALYSAPKKAVGGGSNPYVDDKGKLVFD